MPIEGDRKREYQREWMHNRKIKAQQYLGTSCVSCGSEDNLEFDHKNPNTKVKDVNKLLSGSWEKLKIELDKCQLLCEVCHKLKSDEEMRTPIVHGTYAGYNRNCKCAECMNALRLHKESYETSDEYLEMVNSYPCGSAKKYDKAKCRCALCKNAKSLYYKREIRYSEVII